jgi:hypothetical protein
MNGKRYSDWRAWRSPVSDGLAALFFGNSQADGGGHFHGENEAVSLASLPNLIYTSVYVAASFVGITR